MNGEEEEEREVPEHVLLHRKQVALQLARRAHAFLLGRADLSSVAQACQETCPSRALSSLLQLLSLPLPTSPLSVSTPYSPSLSSSLLPPSLLSPLPSIPSPPQLLLTQRPRHAHRPLLSQVLHSMNRSSGDHLRAFDHEEEPAARRSSGDNKGPQQSFSRRLRR